MSWSDECFVGLDNVCKYEYNLNPVSLELCLLFSTKAFLPVKKSYRYLELGFGQGLSLNIHAAASEAEFWGVDFSPDLAFFANDLAKASGANINIYDESFAEFAKRDGLPEFDIIIMHGIWSFISNENQKIVVDFVARKLAVGGLFYVSYNTPLGQCVRNIPLRDLIKLHCERATRKFDNQTVKINSAIDFLISATEADPDFAVKKPQLFDDITAIKNGRTSYIPRECLSRYWDLVCFSKMTDILSESKLSFAGHGDLLRNIDLLCLTETSKIFLSDITDPVLKEVTRDFLTDHQLRCDLWLKGSRQLNTLEKIQSLGKLKFILAIQPELIDLEVNIPVGKKLLPADTYTSILECLAESSFSPKSVDELVDYYQLRSVLKNQILDALLVLASLNYIYPVQSDEVINKVKSQTNALNAYLLEQAVYSDRTHYLASPVTGGGIKVSRMQQLFLLARSEDASLPEEWASLVWQLISQQGQVTEIETQNIKSPSEGMELLKTMARDFAENRIPILQALGITE